MIAIVGVCYRNYAHYTLYRSCLLIYGIAIVRSLLLDRYHFYFLMTLKEALTFLPPLNPVLQYNLVAVRPVIESSEYQLYVFSTLCVFNSRFSTCGFPS